MLAFIWQRKWLKGSVGIAAAYALALQMMLVGIAATQMAAADPASPYVICYGSHDGNTADGQTGTRINHASCVVCAFVSHFPPLAETGAPLTVALVAKPVIRPVQQDASHPKRYRNPRTSQGPPRIV